MGHYDDPELGASPSGTRFGWTALLVVPALVIGLAGGYLLRVVAEPAAPPPPPVAAPVVPPPAPDRTQCVQVAENGSALVTQVQQGVTAIGRLDPAALQRVLDEIQRLQGQLEDAIGTCRSELSVRPAPAPPGQPALPGPPPPTGQPGG